MSGGLRRSGTHAGALKHMVAVAIEHNYAMRAVVSILKRDSVHHYEGGYAAYSKAVATGAVRPRKLDLTVEQLQRLDRMLSKEYERIEHLDRLVRSEIETLRALGVQAEGGAP
jgi:hypothetical protein